MPNLSPASSKKERFFSILKDVFLGQVKDISGNSPTVKLMQLKSSFYRVIEKTVEREVSKVLEKYPDFEEELYDKLYNFFSRYFSESGCIMFAKTSFHNNIYEKIYSNEDDVVLYWKTKDLYYIKTEKILREMEFDYRNYHFVFDTSNVKGKRGNEKRNVVFSLQSVDKNVVKFEVKYVEGNQRNSTREIVSKLKMNGINIAEEELEEVFRIFNKQSDVDFFLHKNPDKFLKEQFNLWMYQYLSTEPEWPCERLNQLNCLRNVAYTIIDLIAQFENELVKIWQKPRFVINSGYVITLDRIEKKNGWEVLEKIQKHEGWQHQVTEWIKLGIIDHEPKNLVEEDLMSKRLNKQYRFLPIDTAYFKDIEPEILALFDNLDEELDGWLIKSENWQALNTILPKFKGKVQTIYIDPPFNKEQDADYLYMVKFKDSTWATMLENRLSLAREFLKETGAIFVRCDYNGNWIVRSLMNTIFGKENFRNEIILKRVDKQDPKIKKFNTATDSCFFYTKSDDYKFYPIYVNLDKKKPRRWHSMDSQGQGKGAVIFGHYFEPPKGRHWTYRQEKIQLLEAEGRLRLVCKKCGHIHSSGKWEKCPECGNEHDVRVEYLLEETDKDQLDSNWTDVPGYTSKWEFKTENSEIVLKRIIESTSDPGDIVMDFFLGSGTTVAVAHKLRRKWIGIEMGEHFYSVILKRMKKVFAYDSSGISKFPDVEKFYSEDNAGGFMKYYELEQFEDILQKCEATYNSEGVCPNLDVTLPFLTDLKLLHYVEIKEEYQDGSESVVVKIDGIYPEYKIDIGESISNILGVFIKQVSKGKITYTNGLTVDENKPPLMLIKRLIYF